MGGIRPTAEAHSSTNFVGAHGDLASQVRNMLQAFQLYDDAGVLHLDCVSSTAQLLSALL